MYCRAILLTWLLLTGFAVAAEGAGHARSPRESARVGVKASGAWRVLGLVRDARGSVR